MGMRGATAEIKLPGQLEKPEPRARDTTTRQHTVVFNIKNGTYKCLYSNNDDFPQPSQ
jgi:hypothetical protein